MGIGDRYLATIEVTETDHEQYRWDGAGVPLYRDEIKSLEKIPEPLPTEVGSIVKLHLAALHGDAFAVRRIDGNWASTHPSTTGAVLSSGAINTIGWSRV